MQILSEIQNLVDELIVATGLNYPDALSVSSTKNPVLLIGGSLREDKNVIYSLED